MIHTIPHLLINLTIGNVAQNASVSRFVRLTAIRAARKTLSRFRNLRANQSSENHKSNAGWTTRNKTDREGSQL
jgi:hypothetical protein